MMLDEQMIKFILEKMEEQGKTRIALAQHLGKNPSQITRLLRPHQATASKSGKKAAGLTVRELGQIFQFLGVDLSRDIFVAPRKLHVKLAPLRGYVAHGVWRERDMFPSSVLKEIPFLEIPEFTHLDQYAYQVVDTHADQYVPQDAFILCVDYGLARSEPKHNDIVVIERRNSFPAATRNVVTFERAIRKVDCSGPEVTLRALTSEPDVDAVPYTGDRPDMRISDLVLGWISLSPNTQA